MENTDADRKTFPFISPISTHARISKSENVRPHNSRMDILGVGGMESDFIKFVLERFKSGQTGWPEQLLAIDIGLFLFTIGLLWFMLKDETFSLGDKFACCLIGCFYMGYLGMMYQQMVFDEFAEKWEIKHGQSKSYGVLFFEKNISANNPASLKTGRYPIATYMFHEQAGPHKKEWDQLLEEERIQNNKKSWWNRPLYSE